jgi:hypothetical protein
MLEPRRGRPRRTYGAALDRYVPPPPPPRVAKPIGRPRGPQQAVPAGKIRVYRPRRIRYTKTQPDAGQVQLSYRAWLPEDLERRLRQICTYDDRTIAELIALGLTYVVTEWWPRRLSGLDNLVDPLPKVVPLFHEYPKNRRSDPRTRKPTRSFVPRPSYRVVNPALLDRR